MHQIKIYVASKKRHATMLQNLRLRFDGIHFNARWIETASLAINATKPVSHWQQENFDDIEAADVMLVYAERGEHLRNALLEVGYAIRAGKLVYCIGQQVEDTGEGEKGTIYHQDYDDWSAFRQRVRRVPSFDQAILEIKRNILGKAELVPCS